MQHQYKHFHVPVLWVSLLLLLSLDLPAQSQQKLRETLGRVETSAGIKIVVDKKLNDSWRKVSYDECLHDAEVLAYLHILEKELLKYPKGYLKQAHVKTIVLTKHLQYDGQLRAAVPDPYKRQLFLSINGAYGIASTRYLVHVIHHELHHCTEYAIWKSMIYHWQDWTILNSDGFCYGNGGAAAYADYLAKGTDFYSPTNPLKGFINLYSATGAEEDRAEIMAFLMSDDERPTLSQLCKKDDIVKRKTALLIQLLSNFSRRQMIFPTL